MQPENAVNNLEARVKEAEQNKKTIPNDLDKLTDIAHKREQLTKKIGGVFSAIARWLPFVVIQIAGLVVIGLDKFAQGRFDFQYLLSAEFWSRYLNYQMAMWIIGLSWYINIIIRLKKNHVQYLNNIDIIQVLVNYDHENSFIERQVEIEKIIRKKHFLERNIYRQLYKIKLKYEIMSLEAFLGDGGIELHLSTKNLSKTKYNRKKRKLECVKSKIKMLLQQLDYNWQKEYLKHYKIFYPPISRSLLVGGIKAKVNNDGFNDYQMAIVGETATAIAPNSIIATVVGFLILAFRFTFLEAGIEQYIMFAVQVILIMFNTFSLVTLAPSVFERTYLNVSEQRRSDLNKFKVRHENNNIHEKEYVEILDYKSDINY